MPTVAELTDELRRLGGTGYSGKKKAELEVMLADLKKFLASKKAPAPAAEAPKPKPKAVEVAPAPLSAHAESMAKKAKPAKTGAISTPLSALSAGPAKKSLAEEKAELEKEILEFEGKIKKYEKKKQEAKERIKKIDESVEEEGRPDLVKTKRERFGYLYDLSDFIEKKDPTIYKNVTFDTFTKYIVPYSDIPDKLARQLEKHKTTQVVATVMDALLGAGITYTITLTDTSVEIKMSHAFGTLAGSLKYIRRDVFETVSNILSIYNKRLPEHVKESIPYNKEMSEYYKKYGIDVFEADRARGENLFSRQFVAPKSPSEEKKHIEELQKFRDSYKALLAPK